MNVMKKTLQILVFAGALLLASPQAHAACSNPTGQAGEAVFNIDHNVMQYCDDTNWIAMTGGEDNAYSMNAVTFDGTNDYLLNGSALTGVTDGKQITVSFWARFNSIDAGGCNKIMESNPSRVVIEYCGNGVEVMQFKFENTSSIINTNIGCGPDPHVTGVWYHYLVSVDTATGTAHCYVDDADSKQTFTAPTDQVLDFDMGGWSLGSNRLGTNQFFDGQIADVWVDFNNYIDFTVEANRRKFINEYGNPVYLGADGSLPTGIAPEVFMSGATAGWHTNKGSGGGYTLNGSLETYAFTPGNSITTKIVPSGLIGHWRLDETSGTDAFDTSGNDNNGTYQSFGSGAASGTSEGVVATSIVFDGEDEYIRVMNSFNLAEFTVCGWFMPNEGADDDALISKFEDTSNGWWVEYVGGELLIKDDIGSPGSDDLLYQTAIPQMKWTHFCAGINSDPRNFLYINGALIGDSDTPVGSWDDITSDRIYIGQRGNGSKDVDGRLDDIRLYNRALTASEVQEIYNARDGVRYDESANVPAFFDGNRWVSMIGEWPEPESIVSVAGSGSPLGYWTLDETSGSDVTDYGTGGNDGTWEDDTDNLITTESVSGQIDTALDFESGDNAKVVIAPAASIDNLSTMTACAWIRPESITGSYPAVISKFNSISDLGWGLYINAGSDELEFQTRRMGYRSTNSPKITTGTWQHVCATWDGTDDYTGVTLYIGGVERPSLGTYGDWDGSTFDDSGEDLTIGYAEAGSVFDGMIDEVCLFDEELDATAIADIYNNGCGGETTLEQSLLGHWKLDETTGTTAYDTMGNMDLEAYVASQSDFSKHSVPGAVGRAIHRGDSPYNGFLSTPYPLSYVSSGEFTMAGWMNLNQIDGNSAIIGIEDYAQLWKRHDERRMALETHWSSTGGLAVLNTLMPFGQWVHVAVTYSYNDPFLTLPKFYVNGVEDTNVSWLVNPVGTYSTPTPARISVAKRYESSISGFLGAIDDVRYYNRKLTAEEIQMLYNMGTPVGQNTALPQGCPNVGDVCDDGTVYAGLSSDGSVAMFTTPEDAPGDDSYFWNGGNASGYVTTGETSDDTGESNTNAVVILDADSASGGFQEHGAVQYCYDLIAHGSSDWYVPAQNEAVLMRTNQTAIGGFATSFPEYWTSSEYSNDAAHVVLYDEVWTESYSGKENTQRLRCVRKGPAPRCANPYGLEGQMVYNADEAVMQYCDGARWVAIGKF